MPSNAPKSEPDVSSPCKRGDVFNAAASGTARSCWIAPPVLPMSKPKLKPAKAGKRNTIRMRGAEQMDGAGPSSGENPLSPRRVNEGSAAGLLALEMCSRSRPVTPQQIISATWLRRGGGAGGGGSIMRALSWRGGVLVALSSEPQTHCGRSHSNLKFGTFRIKREMPLTLPSNV